MQSKNKAPTPRSQDIFSDRDWSKIPLDNYIGNSTTNYGDLPEEGSKLLTHDLGNVVSKLPWQSKDGNFSKSVYESPENTILWGEENSVTYDEFFEDFERLKDGDYEALDSMAEFNDEVIPDYPRLISNWTERVGEAAREYEKMRKQTGEPIPTQSMELDEVMWFYHVDDGIEVEEESYDIEIEGNEALYFVASTLVQNVYNADKEHETTVTVEENSENVEIAVESVCNEDVNLDNPTVYDSNVDEGLGLPVSSYIIDSLGGDLEIDAEDDFKVSYTIPKIQ